MLTAALREIHVHYPGEFLTDIRSPYPALWQNNPYVTPLDEGEAELVECHYPLIQHSNDRPVHFLQGDIDHLNEKLSIACKPTRFSGDLHLSEGERAAPSPIAERLGEELPYWVLVACGKYDFTIKWWHWRRYQKVINLLRGKVLFVQIGRHGDFHPPLENVVDFRGQTSLRELIRLIRFSEGVLCPVTLSMHLAAAVPPRRGSKLERACVVVAGGREPPHWEAYPNHQFIHTVGSLPCCRSGGCWKLRTVALGDGDDKDQEKHLHTVWI